MKNPIKMDDLGVPFFLETPIYHLYYVLPSGGLYATDPTFYGNQKQPLIGGRPQQIRDSLTKLTKLVVNLR